MTVGMFAQVDIRDARGNTVGRIFGNDIRDASGNTLY